MQQLQHPNLMSLLGYCARSEEMSSLSLGDHGLVAVYEYGQPFYMSTLQRLSLAERLTVAMEMLDLLDYLHTSPLGSLLIGDFKREHFLLVNGRIKLTDLDDVTAAEVTRVRCTNGSRTALKCQGPGRGRGFINSNNYSNLVNLKRHVLTPLFTSRTLVSPRYKETAVNSVTNSNVVTEQTIRTLLQHLESTKELKDRLKSLMF